MRLRLSPNSKAETAQVLHQILADLPHLSGNDISLSIRPELAAYRGKLLSGVSHRGTPVHAAAFIRKRRIVIENTLLDRPGKLRLILVHELFHFVWARAGNSRRDRFTALLTTEIAKRARGELGESAAVMKAALQKAHSTHRNSSWRDYVCESFCDTAAWFYSGQQEFAELTLSKRWSEERRRWFLSAFPKPPAC